MAEDRRLLKVLKILDSKIQCNLDLGKESERERERRNELYPFRVSYATDTSFNKFITEIVTDLFVISQVCLRSCHIRYN